MARYIDADKLIDYFRCAGATFCYGESTIKAIISRIEVMPTADVVEVVRCKDCKSNPGIKTLTKGMVWCRKFRAEVHPDGFCSCGERKEK